MSLILCYPSDTYSGDGEASAWVRRGEEMTEEQRAEFMVRHDTYWV